MTARCPNNPEHTEFITVAHVMQDWRVDADGNFLDLIGDVQVSHKPDEGNTWTCAICGAEANHD